MGEIDERIEQATSEPEELTIPGTADEIIEVADRDIIEQVLPIPEWGYAVRVRSFTAAQSSTVRQIGFKQEGEGIVVDWAAMEAAQFQMGVVEPSFSEQKVRQLQMKSGRGWARIIAWLDEKSGIDKKAMEEVKETFQGPGESA